MVAFTKGHGTGNDFILIADADGTLDITSEQVKKLCDRNFGIGADGLIRVVKSVNASDAAASLAQDPDAEWFMDYRNADGTTAEMCGNGIRVFAHFLVENNLASIPSGSALPVATRAGVKDITSSATGYQVDLGRWELARYDPAVTEHGLDVARPGLGINVGNPHVVVVLSTVEELDALDLSNAPHLNPPATDGANVEFVVPGYPLVDDGVGMIKMRVYERGVGETLSCGTGTAAAALAVRHFVGEGAPDHWKVFVPGGTLAVRMFAAEDGEHVGLGGPAELVFSGEVEL